MSIRRFILLMVAVMLGCESHRPSRPFFPEAQLVIKRNGDIVGMCQMHDIAEDISTDGGSTLQFKMSLGEGRFSDKKTEIKFSRKWVQSVDGCDLFQLRLQWRGEKVREKEIRFCGVRQDIEVVGEYEVTIVPATIQKEEWGHP